MTERRLIRQKDELTTIYMSRLERSDPIRLSAKKQAVATDVVISRRSRHTVQTVVNVRRRIIVWWCLALLIGERHVEAIMQAIDVALWLGLLDLEVFSICKVFLLMV